MLGVDERDAPLAVEVHRHLADLECVRCRELVTEPGLELDQVLVPVPVDHLLLPREPLRPGGVGREMRLAAGVGVCPAPRQDPPFRDVLVEADERVDPDLLQRAVGVANRELLRVRGQLRDRLRRAGDSGLLEQRLVVVEAVSVGEQRQRALLAAVLRVVVRRRREHRRADPGLLHQRREVDPAAGPAVDADVVGVERTDDVRRGACPDGRDDLVVVDAPHDAQRDVGICLLVLGRELLERGQLACAPSDPDGELRRGGMVPGCSGGNPGGGERDRDQRASHGDAFHRIILPPVRCAR